MPARRSLALFLAALAALAFMVAPASAGAETRVKAKSAGGSYTNAPNATVCWAFMVGPGGRVGIGLFITKDPIGHASGETNLYRYANGDPVNRADPSGLCSIAPWSSDSCIAEPAAKILDGISGGISTKLAGAAFDFDADCTDWSDSRIALAAGIVGAGKLRGAARVGRGVRPPNLSPAGAGRRGAFGQAKRDVGIPRSQQPARTRIERDRATGRPQRVYEFDTPDGPVVIRDHPHGHRYPDDPSQNRGSHFNGPPGTNTHYDYP